MVRYAGLHAPCYGSQNHKLASRGACPIKPESVASGKSATKRMASGAVPLEVFGQGYSGGVSGAAEDSPPLLARPRRLPRRRPRRRGRRSPSGPTVSSGPESASSRSSSSSLIEPFSVGCEPVRAGGTDPSRPVPKSSSTAGRDRSGFAGPRDRSRGGLLLAASDFGCSLFGRSVD